MDLSRVPGAHLRRVHIVESHMTAAAVGSGSLDVLSTPWMIALMETVSRDAAQPLLPPGTTTVGIHVDVRHTAPLPVGAEVTVECRVIEVRGKTLLFRVRALGDGEEVGGGTHERAVVHTERFLSRLRRNAP